MDPTTNILEYMKMDFEQSDSRHGFFMSREFVMRCSERGEVGASSVYTSCSCTLSLLYFAVVVLGRPCCLESIILPISVAERSTLEQTWGCPGQHLDGPVRDFQTNWREALGAEKGGRPLSALFMALVLLLFVFFFLAGILSTRRNIK